MVKAGHYPHRSGVPPRTLSELPAGARVREFEIVSVLGSGKSSLTYKAHDHSLNLPRAIKEYLPAGIVTRADYDSVEVFSGKREQYEKGLRRFLAESRYMAQFRHRVFCEAIQFIVENGTAYIVMPYYKGKTLRKLVREGWRVKNIGELLMIILPILNGIILLHMNNYCHCDIAPNNVLISAGPILLDFGAVQQNGVVSVDRPIIDLAPGFAAIEQYEKTELLGPWTDIYALSALSYYAVTGIIPDVSISRIAHDSLKPLSSFATPELPYNVLEVFDQGLEVEPEDRYESIAEFAIDLKEALIETLMMTANPIAREAQSIEQALASFTPLHKEIIENAQELREKLQVGAII